MKWTIRILLLLSLGVNTYFIYDEMKVKRNEELGSALRKAFGSDISKTTWEEGVKLFMAKLREKDSTLADKKYFYINTWAAFCNPCIKEMPWLDSLAGTLHKDVAYVFVSYMSNENANAIIKRKSYDIKNFVFLNDMNDFISGICNKQKTKTRLFPMALILDTKGKLLHYSTGAYENSAEAADFTDMINKLE